MEKQYLEISIWAGIIAVIFAALWLTGNLARLRLYILETREELRKCTWPTWEELRGSTVLVILSVAMLGAFTVGIDYVLLLVVNALNRI